MFAQQLSRQNVRRNTISHAVIGMSGYAGDSVLAASATSMIPLGGANEMHGRRGRERWGELGRNLGQKRGVRALKSPHININIYNQHLQL